jgi:hypothetical protein
MADDIIIPEWLGLGVTVDRGSTMFEYDVTSFRATQRGVDRKYAGIMQVSNDVLDDVAMSLDRLVFFGLDRHMRPWLYPRITPFPAIVLFPRWDRFVATGRKVRSWLAR